MSGYKPQQIHPLPPPTSPPFFSSWVSECSSHFIFRRLSCSRVSHWQLHAATKICPTIALVDMRSVSPGALLPEKYPFLFWVEWQTPLPFFSQWTLMRHRACFTILHESHESWRPVAMSCGLDGAAFILISLLPSFSSSSYIVPFQSDICNNVHIWRMNVLGGANMLHFTSRLPI